MNPEEPPPPPPNVFAAVGAMGAGGALCRGSNDQGLLRPANLLLIIPGIPDQYACSMIGIPARTPQSSCLLSSP